LYTGGIMYGAKRGSVHLEGSDIHAVGNEALEPDCLDGFKSFCDGSGSIPHHVLIKRASHPANVTTAGDPAVQGPSSSAPSLEPVTPALPAAQQQASAPPDTKMHDVPDEGIKHARNRGASTSSPKNESSASTGWCAQGMIGLMMAWNDFTLRADPGDAGVAEALQMECLVKPPCDGETVTDKALEQHVSHAKTREKCASMISCSLLFAGRVCLEKIISKDSHP
jgi:hypothetical protein